MKLLTVTVSLLISTAFLHAQNDTLWISSYYTTHVIFPTDIVYADLSNSTIIAAKVVDQDKNILAIRANGEFAGSASISALERNGAMHTYVVRYDDSPESLVIDMRTEMPGDTDDKSVAGFSMLDAIRQKRRIYHVGEISHGISVFCENVFVHADNTYIVLSLKNSSSIGYDIQDASFVLESRKRSRRTVSYDRPLFPRSRYGSLSSTSGESSKAVYAFEKLTLADDQELKVYLYEEGGARNMAIAIEAKVINRAILK